MDIITIDADAATLPTPPKGPQDPAGPLWVEVRPDLRRLHVVAGDILAALGKRRDIAGKGRNEHDDITHAQAWLSAHATPELVVLHAQRLRPHTLGRLCELVGNAGLQRLWLPHTPPPSDAHAHALARRATRVGHLDEVPPAIPAPTPDTHRTCDLPAVPAAEFTTFWSACQQHLSGDDLERTRTRLADAITACEVAFNKHGANQDAVAGLVFNILNHAPTDDQLIIDIRALQLTAWHRDLYVKVHHNQLHQHEERPRLPQTEVDDAMLAYRQPYRPLTAALTRAGRGIADIAAITLADCDAGAESLRCEATVVTLTAAAGTALRAQIHLRHVEGAVDGDPLLPHTPKALAKALTDARIDLGIHVHGRRVERTRDHTTRALRQLGISVHKLP